MKQGSGMTSLMSTPPSLNTSRRGGLRHTRSRLSTPLGPPASNLLLVALAQRFDGRCSPKEWNLSVHCVPCRCLLGGKRAIMPILRPKRASVTASPTWNEFNLCDSPIQITIAARLWCPSGLQEGSYNEEGSCLLFTEYTTLLFELHHAGRLPATQVLAEVEALVQSGVVVPPNDDIANAKTLRRPA